MGRIRVGPGGNLSDMCETRCSAGVADDRAGAVLQIVDVSENYPRVVLPFARRKIPAVDTKDLILIVPDAAVPVIGVARDYSIRTATRVPVNGLGVDVEEYQIAGRAAEIDRPVPIHIRRTHASAVIEMRIVFVLRVRAVVVEAGRTGDPCRDP